MKEKLLSWGTLLCLAVLTCLLLVHALAIFPGVSAIRWFFATSAVVFGRLDAPAWVQAVGSVVAIFSAIGIAMWQRLAEKKAERSRAYFGIAVVGSTVHAQLTMSIALGRTMLFHFKQSSIAGVRERAKFLQPAASKMQLPNQEQMLLMAPAMPQAAGEIAKGVAAMAGVSRTLDDVAAASALSAGNEDVLMAYYAGARVNLITAVRCFRRARSLMNKLPPLN